MVLNFILIALNLVIGNHFGVLIDLCALFFVIIPVLYLNKIRKYEASIFLFVFGYHLAAIIGCVQTIIEGRINEIELLLIPGAIGIAILLRGNWQVVIYLLNMVAMSVVKYMRWQDLDMPSGDFYKMQAIIALTYVGIYFFITQFKSQLMLALKHMKFLNDALSSNEKQLKESNNAKDRLFSIIAHDLRSPLDLIQGLLDPVMLENLEKEELIKHQTTIRSRIGVLQETMNNLLIWAKTQLGKIEVHAKEVSVVPSSRVIIDLFDEMIVSKGITVSYLGAKKIKAYVDVDHFNVIMRNIIHNAIKYTPANGTIELETRETGEFVHIKITDSGAGFDHEIKEKIMNSQLVKSGAGTAGEQGSGIGLSFCHELLAKNGGKMNLFNVKDGGACTEVVIPKSNSNGDLS